MTLDPYGHGLCGLLIKEYFVSYNVLACLCGELVRSDERWQLGVSHHHRVMSKQARTDLFR